MSSNSLIEQLESLKVPLNGNIINAVQHEAINSCIAIVRQHQAAPDVAGALKHLIHLKEHKDQYGKTPYYECEQPFAWLRAKAAIAALHDHAGDATDREAVDAGSEGLNTSPAPASQPSEIPIAEIEQLAVSRIATWLMRKYNSEYDASHISLDVWQEQAREIWALVRHYPPKAEPVSVSLEKCIDLIGEIDIGSFHQPWKIKDDWNPQIREAVVKAVLDAAGVKYVD